MEVVFNASGLGLLESHHDEGFFMGWRSDAYPKVLLVVGGKGWLHLPDCEWELEAPVLIVIPEGTRHRLSDRKGQPMSIYGLCLNQCRFPRKSFLQEAFGTIRKVDLPLVVETAQGLFRSILLEERDKRPGHEEMQMAAVTEMLVFLVRQSSVSADELPGARQRVADYVRRLPQIFWKKQRIDDVARELSMSRRRFTQLFKEMTGETWLERVRRMRMNHARKLLKTTRLSVRSVAFECGYEDLSHFYRHFKETFGKAPGAVRL